MNEPQQTLQSMLKYKVLPQHIESVFIHNILKIFAYIMDKYERNEKYDEILSLCDSIIDKMSESIKSGELEVQERASTSLIIIKIAREEIEASKLKIIVFSLFIYKVFFKELRSPLFSITIFDI